MKHLFRRLMVRRLLLASACLVLTACGRSGTVNIQSSAFSTTGSTSTASLSAAADVTSFKFCVSRIRLENEDGDTETKDDHDEITFAPGLINVSTGQAVSWGKVEVPVGFKLRAFRVKVHHDPGLCGMNPSIEFNGTTTQQDVELRFRLNPPVDIDSNDTLTLQLNAIVAHLRAAADGGSIASLKQRVEEVEGSASK